MAKKKTDDALKYLQTPIPTEQKRAVTLRINWSGLNRAQDMDTGELALEKNISTSEAPALSPCPKPEKLTLRGEKGELGINSPVGLWGFDDFLLLLFDAGGGKIGAARIDRDGNAVISEFPRADKYGDDLETERSVVAMNLYDASIANGGVAGGTYTKKLLVFPDRVVLDFEAGKNGWSAAIIPDSQMPNIRFATVHLSRLYGIAAPSAGGEPDRVCVSAYNNYADWSLDTDDDFSEAHAWVSPAQSNVRATGAFTGIATYLNSVVAFKRDYMHEITGSANPFRINDVFAEGALNNRCIVEVDGSLFFVSDDAVKVYTGGNPRVMSYKLGVKRFVKPAAGTDGRKYYLFCRDEGNSNHLFVYDTAIMAWAEEDAPDNIISFARMDHGLYALVRYDEGGGDIMRMDSGVYKGQSWRAETDIALALAGGKSSVDIKHIQKLQILADIDPGSRLKAELAYNDGSGGRRVEEVFQKTNDSDRVIRTAIRVIPRNSAHWGARLILSGTGFVKLYHAELTAKAGGGLYTTLKKDMTPEPMNSESGG